MRLGKDKPAIFLAAILLFSASSYGQAGKSYKYQFQGNLQDSDVIIGKNSITINYSISEVDIESITNDNGSFYRISVPGHIPTSIPGRPELPVFSRLISIPGGAESHVKISQVKSSKINPSGKKFKGLLIPKQESGTKAYQGKKPEFIIDKMVYASRELITSDTVVIEPLGTLRNTKLANLFISPVRYNPHSNILEVINSMKIEITFSYSNTPFSKSYLTESALFSESIDKGILNYNPDDVIPGYSDQPVKMIIVTDTSFKKHLDPFIKWKTQKGYKLNILYKGTGMAGNTYTELKDTLTKIYRSGSASDPPPEYLLIIGDVKKVPYYGTGNITDMYYGEFDGNGDYFPEMFIGRLPVADTTELKSVVKKIIQYEKFEFADTNKFYTRSLVTAGNDAGYAGLMNGQVNYAVTNYLTSENNIESYHFYYPQSTEATAEDSIKRLIKRGVSFINYSGHGDANGWLDPTIKVKDLDSLKNKDMYPFVISNACKTSLFSDPSPFSNKMVLSVNKGAIGFVGCSNDSYWDEDFYWAVGPGTPSSDPTYQGTGLGAYDRLFHTNGELSSDWYTTMGQVNYAGNLAVSASNTTRKKYYWETYNLVGDPSVIPILGTPGTFDIHLPDTLPNGIKSLSLNADPFSYIAVSHFDTLWDASFVSPSGSVTLDMPGITDDSCLIVMTGQNKLPLIKTIYFSDVQNEFINLTSSSINDIQGNNNQKADFGETFYLNLVLSNLGLTDAESLYAKVSSSSDLLTFSSDSVFIGTLPARTDIILSDDFELTISDEVPDMAVVTINLMIKDQKSEKHYSVEVCVHAPDLKILSCLIDDTLLGNGNQIPDPGETFNLVFTVQNMGSSDISGQFEISSPGPDDISILEPSVKSGLLKFGEITDIAIMVKLSEEVLTGDFISIFSILDCNPYIVNKDFNFRVGRIRESFETTSFNTFPWINLSPIPWVITGTNSYEGTHSARSGAISHNGTTSLSIRTIFTTPDSIKFSYKVSSETNYDNFSFRLNGNEVLKNSGETPWIRKTFAVPAGLNTMEWIYKKDQSVSNGADCAWIDMIDFADRSSVSYIQKDLQVARLVSPVQKDKYGNNEIVTVKVLNIGKDPINGFYLAYKINDQWEPIQQFFENQLGPFGDSVTVSFKAKADLSKYGIYEITAYGFNNDDDYILNDTVRLSLEYTEINEAISIFPNPFNDQLTIFINSMASERVKISITSLAGVRLYEVERDILIGKNSIKISDIRLSPSIYYLNIKGDIINKTIRILKINK